MGGGEWGGGGGGEEGEGGGGGGAEGAYGRRTKSEVNVHTTRRDRPRYQTPLAVTVGNPCSNVQNVKSI